ncbi:MAG: hypothetical protein F6K47_32010 [Symploca sp. SIO2E6]|nr:hypothetical protein [Symploca sp. SIO2E6]
MSLSQIAISPQVMLLTINIDGDSSLTHPTTCITWDASVSKLLVVSCLSKNKKQTTNNKAAGGYPSHLEKEWASRRFRRSHFLSDQGDIKTNSKIILKFLSLAAACTGLAVLFELAKSLKREFNQLLSQNLGNSLK